MTTLYEHIKDKKLTEIYFPGSHDSNSNTLKDYKLLQPYAKCQDVDVN